MIDAGAVANENLTGNKACMEFIDAWRYSESEGEFRSAWSGFRKPDLSGCRSFFRVFFLFCCKLFHELAFAAAFQLRPEPVLAEPGCNEALVGFEGKHDDPLAEGLSQEEEKKQGSHPFFHGRREDNISPQMKLRIFRSGKNKLFNW
jgi:hypothetical protein